MKNTWLLLLLLLPVMAVAGGKDRVRLKDGSIYNGKVINYQQNGPVVIEITDGQQISVPSDQILDLRMSLDDAAVNVPEEGFYNQLSLGLLAGSNQYGRAASFSVKVINGYQITPHFGAGLGVGLEPLEINTAPLFLQLKTNFLAGDHSPYLDVRGGWILPLTQTTTEFEPRYYGGPLFQLTMGGQFKTSTDLSLFCEAGYRLQRFRYELDQQSWWNTEPATVLTTQNQFQRLDVSIGLRFN